MNIISFKKEKNDFDKLEGFGFKSGCLHLAFGLVFFFYMEEVIRVGNIWSLAPLVLSK
jgi:hypothetical protein